MRFSLLFSALSTVVVLVQGCASGAADPAQLTACTEPRPQVCTMVYDPVCAMTTDERWEARSSACNACADDSVVGYRDSACPEDSTP